MSLPQQGKETNGDTITTPIITPTTDGAIVVAVTGASGFVGSHLCENLLQHGYTVRACLRNVNKQGHLLALEERHKASGGKLEICLADMSQRGSYDKIFEGCRIVFHVAGNFGTDYHSLWKTQRQERRKQEYPNGRLPPVDDLLKEIGDAAQEQEDLPKGTAQSDSPSYDHAVYESYLIPMKWILESIGKNLDTIERVVYTSSGAAGGTITLRFDEDEESALDEAILENAYGRAKQDCESQLYEFCRDHSIIGLSACPCIILGPLMGVVHDSVYQHRWSDMLRGRYRLPHSWEVADVRDIAVAQRLLAEDPSLINGTRIYIGSDPSWSVRELLDSVAHHKDFVNDKRFETLRSSLAETTSSSDDSSSSDDEESGSSSEEESQSEDESSASGSSSSSSSYGISEWDNEDASLRATTWSDPVAVLTGYTPRTPSETILDTTRSILDQWDALGRTYSLKEACDYYTVAEMDGCDEEMSWLEHHRIRNHFFSQTEIAPDN